MAAIKKSIEERLTAVEEILQGHGAAILSIQETMAQILARLDAMAAPQQQQNAVMTSQQHIPPVAPTYCLIKHVPEAVLSAPLQQEPAGQPSATPDLLQQQQLGSLPQHLLFRQLVCVGQQSPKPQILEFNQLWRILRRKKVKSWRRRHVKNGGKTLDQGWKRKKIDEVLEILRDPPDPIFRHWKTPNTAKQQQQGRTWKFKKKKMKKKRFCEWGEAKGQLGSSCFSRRGE